MRNYKSLLSFIFLLGVSWSVASAQDGGVPPASLLANPSFEESHVVDGKTLPVSWTLSRWNNEETMVPSAMQHFGDKKVVQVPACGSGGVGLTSDPQPIPKDSHYLSVDLSVSKSWDCTSSPWAFITWCKGDKVLGQSDLNIETDCHGWTTFYHDVHRSEIPDGADHFRINIATKAMKGSAETPRGFTIYDDVIVTTRDTARPICLKPTAEFAWFEDQPVKYVSERTPMELKAVRGTVCDSSGKVVEVVTVDRKQFADNGWVWNAPEPGLYDITFEVLDADGMKLSTRSWASYIAFTNKNITSVKERYTAAVVKKGQWKERPIQFGLDVANITDQREVKIRMAARLGFSFVRAWLDELPPWVRYKLNPAPGVYQWDMFDKYWALYKQYGFKRNLITFLGTPAWASPYPDKNEVDVVAYKYTEYPPTDLSHFTDFVAAAVKHYGDDVKDWEIWNEPHFPDQTCFWKGTPADYVALLKASYETIKRLQPESTVWLGGMGPRRYAPFYKDIIKAGCYPYFDMYSAHGQLPEINICHKIEAEAGVKSKPWSSSEWHAVLVTSDTVQTDEELGRRMMTDLFLQLKNGVDRMVLYRLLNMGMETEVLDFMAANGNFAQSFGLFRERPDIEPRLPSVVLHDFLTRFSGRIDYTAEYDFDTQKAVLLTTGDKKLLLTVWNEGVSSPLDARLAKIVSSASSATTWEGKPWKSNQLDAKTMVYFTDVDRAALDALHLPSTALFYPSDRRKPLPTASVRGKASSLPLFAKVTDELNSGISWIPTEKLVFKGLNNNSRPAGFSARFAVYADKAGLNLAVDVRDVVHCQEEKTGEFWKGDSIQFALDGEDGINGRTEFTVALTPSESIIWKDLAPERGGDLPSKCSHPRSVVKNAKVAIQKTDEGLLYKVHVPWSEFYPYSFDPKKPLRCSLVVNDNDKNGRLGWLQWSDGIAGNKQTRLFGEIQMH